MKRNIVLLSDFGLEDSYVGVMKGVVTNININANIIDLTHSIAPQNIKQAAFILMNSYSYFPKGTIFVAVVDPGVGSNREAICIKTMDYYFIGPNNGIFTYVLAEQEIETIVKLENPKFFLENISNTFHGRDVFAPVAGHLSKGICIDEFGSNITDSELVMITELKLENTDYTIIGELLYADRFGNIITSICSNDLLMPSINNIRVGEFNFSSISSTFSDVKEKELLVYIGSSGYLEIGMRNGSAIDIIGLTNNIEITYN